MNTRTIALLAAAAFTGVASAQTNITNSLSVIGASHVGPNAYEVDIYNRNTGSLTIVLSSQLNNPGNFRGISAVIGNLHTVNAGVNVAYGATTHAIPFNSWAADPGGTFSNYQALYNSQHFPSALPQPTGDILGIGAPVDIYTLVINFSNATNTGTITISDDFTQGFAFNAFAALAGSWVSFDNPPVSRVGAQPVTISFIPTPGALSLLGLGSLLATRRRR